MPANPFQNGSILSFVDVGSETQVNVETTSNQQNPTVAVLSNGNTVVAWESNGQDGSGLGVYARVFGPDGVPITGELAMNVTTANNQDQPEVIALDNGRAMVIWQSGGDIWYRLIEADGTTPTGEFQINGTSTASNFEVTSFASEDFMVTWESPDGVGTSSGVYGQRIAFNGTEIFGEFRINDEILGAQQRADTAELTSGTVFTVFQSQGQTAVGSDQGIYLRNYSNTSTLAGSDIEVSEIVGEQETNPQIQALDGGGFAVAWVNNTTGTLWAQTYLNTGAAVGGTLTNISGAVGVNTLKAPVMTALPGDRYAIVWENTSAFSADLYYKVLEADGTTVTTGRLHTLTASIQTDAQLHALPQGGFITVFTTGDGGPGLDVYITRHADDGTPVGPPLQLEYPVNTQTSDSQSAPDVTVTDAGEIVVTWHSNAQDGSLLGVYLQRLASPEIGTTADDNITGDTGPNFISGWIGNDTIRGLDGDDRLDGGTGDDQLIGAAGNDILTGGAGMDQLSGGNNNDTLEGGADADLLFGNGGNDSIMGDAGNDTAFGGAGADVLFGGDDNDELSGQGAADTLSGDSGADTLRGGSGSDSLQGGDDNDQLLGQGNNDTLEGGAGDDVLQGAAGLDLLRGEAGNDTLTGSIGTDTLDGGTGNDVMNGGGADGVTDTFIYMLGYEQDRINTFDQVGTDLLQLDQDLWIGVNPGLTEQQVIDTYGSLNGTGSILTLDFGGGDVLEIQNAGGINQATLGADVIFI